MAEPSLTPQAILGQLNANGVTHVVWLPDSETNFMYEKLVADPSLHLVPVRREGESMAIAAGLWVGGKKPVVLIQNTGLFESGDSVRGLTLDVNFPLVMMIGYRGLDPPRGYDGLGSALHRADPAWPGESTTTSLKRTTTSSGSRTAFADAERGQHPVACLMGTEYGQS